MLEDVVVDRRDAVEDGDVGGAREAHAAPRRRQRGGDSGGRLAEERTRPADLDREQGAKLRRRRHEAERGSIHAEALEILCGEVDPVEPVVDPDVPNEFVSWNATPSLPNVSASRRAPRMDASTRPTDAALPSM